jgi:polyisoprenoid-binding protein YceI
MKHTLLTLGMLLGAAQPAMAEPYSVDYSKSKVEFSGMHAGNAFTGIFKEWKSDIDFNFDAPEESQLNATFQLESAETGSTMYDGTLPTADWFDVSNTPEGTFKSTSIQEVRAGQYQADGILTLKGKALPVSFPFTILTTKESSEKKYYSVNAEFSLNRLDYGIGEKSDPSLEWVDNKIVIKLQIIAH